MRFILRPECNKLDLCALTLHFIQPKYLTLWKLTHILFTQFNYSLPRQTVRTAKQGQMHRAPVDIYKTPFRVCGHPP